MSDLPRYENLPLFNPHRKSFTCVYQDQHVPPVDPQAELWFQQALALDDPDVHYQKRDYPQIYRLYVQAADRGHWKAMLNLASLILGNAPGVPEHDPESAVRWIEEAMRMGVPDAYDMMGIYHQNKVIKGGDATTAYAFFQRAADMGSPSAMTFLGEKLAGTYDDPEGEFWGNLPIATQMLECAFAQGYGPAAYKLGFIYKRANTTEAKTRALRVLNQGVKLGCEKCANKLSVEFNGIYLTDGTGLVDAIDKGRAERYSKIGDTLEHYQGRLKLPNLDKVLPLPPAPLPKWDGNVKTLIDAAKAVTPPPKKNQGAALDGRERMAEGHGVLSLADSAYAVSGDKSVPETGYWLATYGLSTMTKTQLRFARNGRPERYRAGERFEAPTLAWLGAEHVQWHFLGEARPMPPGRDVYLTRMIDAGWLRQIPSPSLQHRCYGVQNCPETGIWEGRVADDHPLAALYNLWHRQAFVEKGQSFPDPREHHLDIEAEQVKWTWLGSPNRDGTAPGGQEIAL
ncbi:TPA: sel1 repeat family protein [Burkholderia vietnamiensis]|nr:DUF6396 domain-containing protein [Burkholderia vietnamiensis]MBR8084518.1 sel1 repeat family protein [Burkholderia vietnamiensis]HDR9039028.1 sel1 repeat family protein [Burkholderia vietnamiensis]